MIHPGSTNIAQHKLVSGKFDGFTGSAVVDGNVSMASLTTSPSALSHNCSDPMSVTIDLGALYYLTAVRALLPYGYNISLCGIQTEISPTGAWGGEQTLLGKQGTDNT